MSKVIVTKSKLDTLASVIGGKSNTEVPLTLDEMITVADSITSGGGAPNLQTKSESYTPTESAISDTITPDAGYDGLDEFNISISAIPSNYVGSGITQRTSSSLSASGATVTAPAGYYASSASKSVSSGTAGTPTASKGAVSSHSISVTPSVTNTTGYITGSTKTGTAVSVSASELVSGTLSVSTNGQQDVTNYQYVDVNVSGGGGSGLDLLHTESVGHLQTSSTTATDTGIDIVLDGVTSSTEYDLLVVDMSVDSAVNGRHTSTVSIICLSSTTSVSTKSSAGVYSNKWNSRLSSDGVGQTTQSTTAYGVYASSSIRTTDDGEYKFDVYYRYNANHTLTINGDYTCRVYGVKLYDLIGG